MYIEYPVLIPMHLVRHTTEKLVLCWDQIEIDNYRKSDKQAPVLLNHHDAEYRFIEDGVYKRINNAIIDTKYSIHLNNEMFENDYLKEIYEKIEYFRLKKIPIFVPHKIEQKFVQTFNGSGNIILKEKIINLHENKNLYIHYDTKTLTEYRKNFREHINGNYIVVNDMLYQKVHEPFLEIQYYSKHKTYRINIIEEDFETYLKSKDNYKYSYLFTLDRLEEAKDFLNIITSNINVKKSKKTFDTYINLYFKSYLNSNLLNVYMICNTVVRHYQDQPVPLNQLSENTLNIYSTARKFLKHFNEESNEIDKPISVDTAQEFICALELLITAKEELSFSQFSYGNNWIINSSILKNYVDLWNSIPIYVTENLTF